MDTLMEQAINKADVANFLKQSKQRIEIQLEQWLSIPQHPYKNLVEAMRYATLNGGKRIRAALIYSIEQELQIPTQVSDHIAAAVEAMHASSLVHDDLPALDNDELRRGQPACHIAHGEAMALLAGDGLLNLSHQIIAAIPEQLLSPAISLQLLRKLGQVIGTEGMIGGQAMEFSFDQHPLPVADVEKLYVLKTGCLLGCGLQMAMMVSPLTQEQPEFITLMEDFSWHAGLAFQIYDDILDMEVSSEQLGKPQHSDAGNDRQTYVQCVGMEKAKQQLAFHEQQAKACLEKTGFELAMLHQLVNHIITREF